jgi:hypothetical protein
MDKVSKYKNILLPLNAGLQPHFLQSALPCLIERITVEPNDEVRGDMTEIGVCLLQGLHIQNDTWKVVSVTEKCCSVTSHTDRLGTVRYVNKIYTIPHGTVLSALLGSLIPHTSPASVHCIEYILRVL